MFNIIGNLFNMIVNLAFGIAADVLCFLNIQKSLCGEL